MESVLQLGAVMPAQFLVRRMAPMEGERRLMLAVLENGVFSYQRSAVSRRPGARLEFETDQEWVESDDRESLFSFENICDTLGIDAGAMRKALRASVHAREGRLEARSPKIVLLARSARRDLPSADDAM